MHAWITDAMFLALTAEAERRRVHPDRLTAQILEGVLRNDLVGFLDQPEFA